MKKMILTITLILGEMIQLIFLATSANAARFGGSAADIRYDRTPGTISLVKVSGNLICDRGAINQGSACDLKIQDRKTGRVFVLTHSDQAMELLNQGAKIVTVEGTLEGSNTIQVNKAQAL